MATNGGGDSIKVGSGHIEITPELDRRAMAALTATINQLMERAGEQTGEDYGEAIRQGILTTARSIRTTVRAIATTEARERIRAAQRAEEAILRAETERVRASTRLEIERVRATQSAEAQRVRATQQTTRAQIAAETEANRQRARLEEQNLRIARDAERARQALLQETARMHRETNATILRVARDSHTEQLRLLRSQRQEERRAHEQRVQEIRERLAAERAAAKTALREEMANLQSRRRELQRTLTTVDTASRGIGRRLTDLGNTTYQAWHRAGQGLETWGTKVTELGRTITTHLVGPLMQVNALAAGIGMKSADSYRTLELNLQGLGATQSQINDFVKIIQSYAVDTPYSLEMMQNLSPILARSIATNDPRWNDKKTRGEAVSTSINQSADIIRFIGDNAAAAGITNSSYIETAIKAVEQMISRDKITATYLNQLDRGSGLPVGMLAQLLGYGTDAEGSAASKIYTDIVKKRDEGGVSGYQLAKTLSEAYGEDTLGTRGSAARITQETFSGQAQQLMERINLGLGGLFRTRGTGDEESQLTPLGEKVNRLIDELAEIAAALKDPAKKSLTLFFDVLGWVAEQVQSAFAWLDEHPEIKALGEKLLKIAIIAGPLVIAFGLLVAAVGMAAKVLGGITRMAFKPLAGAVKGTYRGGRAGARYLSQVTGVGSETDAERRGREGREAAQRRADAMRRRARELNDTPNRTPEMTQRAARLNAGADSRVAAARQEAQRLREEERANTSRRDRYRARRTNLRGGDERGLGRRAWDRVRGRNSNNANQARNATREIDDIDRRMEELREEIRNLSAESLSALARQIAGPGPNSLQGAMTAASDATDEAIRNLRDLQDESMRNLAQQLAGTSPNTVQGAVTSVRDAVDEATRGVNNLGNQSLTTLHGNVTDLKNEVDQLGDKLRQAQSETQTLDGKNLSSLKAKLSDLSSKVEAVRTSVGQLIDRIGNLNDATVSAIRDRFDGGKDSLRSAVNEVYKLVGAADTPGSVSNRITNLNKRTLDAIRQQFQGGKLDLYGAVSAVYDRVGTTKLSGSLINRLVNLDDRKLNKVKKQVDDLKSSLDKAATEAGKLNDRLNDISKNIDLGGGDSGGGKKDTKRKSRGGVLPGYHPGVDSIPALLSPGEGILRPEVVKALGASTINRWNSLAIRGAIPRFAKGGIVESTGLDTIRQLVELQNIAPIGQAAIQTMTMDSASNALGGNVAQGILGVGDGTARWSGGAAANRFQNMYTFMTENIWDLLKRVPTGVGQVAGILGGAIMPTVGQHFWNDVWKGQGNIVDRGNKFLGNVFSWETLSKAGGDLIGGLWDSVSSLWETGKAIVTDPVGAVSDMVDQIFGTVGDSYNNIIGMVDVVRDIRDAPKDHAARVFTEFMSTAKEAMPNTKGLFDFEEGAKVSSNSSINWDELLGSPNPKGDAVGRWKPLVQRVLAELGLAQSYTDLVLHRIRVESGGNPSAINLWDSNAQNGYPSQGLMQTIPQTFAAYAGKYRSRGIRDPLANIYAGMNYAVNRYGSRWPQALSGTKGYWTGTLSASPGMALVGERGPELVDFRGGERVYNSQETEGILSGRKYEIHIHEAKSEDSTQAVLRAMKYAEAMYGNL